MRFSKVIISESMERLTGVMLKRWKKYELEVELSPGDSADEAKEVSDAKLTEWHREDQQKQLFLGQISESQYQSFSPEIIPEVQVDKAESWEESMIKGIQLCDRIESGHKDDTNFLKSFARAASQNQSVKEAYDTRLKELKNK